MAQTKFFTRSSSNLEEYKSNFKKALQMSKTVKLFDKKVISFLQTWIDAQVNYIPREDIDHFLTHLNHIFKDKHFYNYIVWRLSLIKDNWKIQEYSFNLISKLDDAAKVFEKSEKRRKLQETLEKNKLKSKREDEEEMKNILENL